MDINLLLEPRGSESPASRMLSSKVAKANSKAPLLDNTSLASYNSPIYANGSSRRDTCLPGCAKVSCSASKSTPAPPMPGAEFGGPVLPAFSGLELPARPADWLPLHQGIKRNASETSLSDESSAKRQSKWTPEADELVIELRGQGCKWDDIAKRLLGRSPTSYRLRYQNYLEQRDIWDEEKKLKLAMFYARCKDQMWQMVATEMGVPWRSAESMHWQLGEEEMSARANAPLFQLHPSTTPNSFSSQSVVVVAPARELAPTAGGSTPVITAQSMAGHLRAPAENIRPPFYSRTSEIRLSVRQPPGCKLSESRHKGMHQAIRVAAIVQVPLRKDGSARVSQILALSLLQSL